MTSFEKAQRFFASGWKELDTCIQIHIDVRREMDYCQGDQAMYQTLKATCHELERLTYVIAKRCLKLNPAQRDENGNMLPRVAWVPQPVLDEETGLTSTPKMPDIPEFTSVKEKAFFLKSLADAALIEAVDEEVKKDTHETEAVHEEPNETTTEEVAAPQPDNSKEVEQDYAKHNATPAEAAIAAIRSRRKKTASQA